MMIDAGQVLVITRGHYSLFHVFTVVRARYAFDPHAVRQDFDATYERRADDDREIADAFITYLEARGLIERVPAQSWHWQDAADPDMPLHDLTI
jgi:hypothetical protein